MDSKPVLLQCEMCSKPFKVRKSLLRHQSEDHGREKRGQKCVMCDKVVTNIIAYCAQKAHAIELQQCERTFD